MLGELGVEAEVLAEAVAEEDAAGGRGAGPPVPAVQPLPPSVGQSALLHQAARHTDGVILNKPDFENKKIIYTTGKKNSLIF